MAVLRYQSKRSLAIFGSCILSAGLWASLFWLGVFSRPDDWKAIMALVAMAIAAIIVGSWLAGRHPIYKAVEREDWDAVRTLLKTDPDMQDKRHMTTEPPIVIAVEFGSRLILERLLEAGADPDVSSDGEGITPLHLAVRAGRVDLVELLLRHKAAVTATDEHNETPLHYAASLLHHAGIPELLLNHGAPLEAANQAGETPLDLAVANGNTEIAELLRRHGAVKTGNEHDQLPGQL